MPSVTNNRSMRLTQHWFGDGPSLPWPQRAGLWLLSLLYMALAGLRLGYLAIFSRPRPVPNLRTVAVGNLIVGGAGKTPCVIALAEALTAAGISCGLITRGYRSAAEHQASRVIDPNELPHTPAAMIGDEAWLMAWRTQLPIAVGKNRFEGALALKRRYPNLQVALLDDGLQQATLATDLKILVLDERGFGNGHCLPLGPLREPIGELSRFDAWIDNGYSSNASHPHVIAQLPNWSAAMSQSNAAWVPLSAWSTPQDWLDLESGLAQFQSKRILAVAGIAVPERFFQTLQTLGLTCDTLALQDHDPQIIERVNAQWASQNYDVILMTEKDAVKFFSQVPTPTMPIWALRRQATLDSEFLTRFVHGLQTA